MMGSDYEVLAWRKGGLGTWIGLPVKVRFDLYHRRVSYLRQWLEKYVQARMMVIPDENRTRLFGALIIG